MSKQVTDEAKAQVNQMQERFFKDKNINSPTSGLGSKPVNWIFMISQSTINFVNLFISLPSETQPARFCRLK